MYKHIRISFHTEKHRKAIERLKPLSGHWRSNYVAASIESYDKKDNGHAARDAGNGPTGIDEPTPIYKRIWISLHTEKHRKAIEILHSLPRHWRSNYVAAAIESYDKKGNGQAARDDGNDPTGIGIDKSAPIQTAEPTDNGDDRDTFFG